jgi:hypothetical protein
MVETIRKHICDHCGKTYIEGEKQDEMYPLTKWRTVAQHTSSNTGLMWPFVTHIFCGFHCLRDWANKQALKEQN